MEAFNKGPEIDDFEKAAAVYFNAIAALMLAAEMFPKPESMVAGVMDVAMQGLLAHGQVRSGTAAPFVESASQCLAMVMLRTEDPETSVQQFADLLVGDMAALKASWIKGPDA